MVNEKIKSMALPVLTAGAVMVPSLTSFAAEGTPAVDVTGTLTTAATTIQGDMLAAVNSMAPIALVVVGAVMALKFGIKFFRSIAK